MNQHRHAPLALHQYLRSKFEVIGETRIRHVLGSNCGREHASCAVSALPARYFIVGIPKKLSPTRTRGLTLCPRSLSGSNARPHKRGIDGPATVQANESRDFQGRRQDVSSDCDGASPLDAAGLRGALRGHLRASMVPIAKRYIRHVAVGRQCQSYAFRHRYLLSVAIEEACAI